MLYSNGSGGKYPPDLGTLATTENLPAQVFVHPGSGNTPPPGLTPDQAADWINHNSDYIYIGADQKPGADPNVVICYEKDSISERGGINMLFADGHVEFAPLDAAHLAINNSTKPH
jgi:prepilin-type processing-associated H-X9-DG protein